MTVSFNNSVTSQSVPAAILCSSNVGLQERIDDLQKLNSRLEEELPHADSQKIQVCSNASNEQMLEMPCPVKEAVNLCLACGGHGCSLCVEKAAEDPSEEAFSPPPRFTSRDSIHSEVRDIATSSTILRKKTTQGMAEVSKANRSAFASSKSSKSFKLDNEALQSSAKQATRLGLEIDEHAEFEGSLRWYARKIVSHTSFQIGVGFVIALNGIMIGIETDCAARNIEANWVYPVEVTFTVFYILELAARFYADYRACLKDKGFLFDLFLVVLAISDTLILQAMAESSSLSSFMLLRLLRLFKVARIFRLLRVVRELWLLISTIVDSVRLMVWYGIVLLCLIYTSGIFVVQMVTSGLHDKKWPDPEDEEFVRDRFGTLDQCMFTLFECLVDGEFMESARRVIEGIPELWVFFVFYTVLAQITILNVIVAIIVESTLRKTLVDNEKEKLRMIKKEHEEVSALLTKLFMASDTSGDGEVSRQEWVDACSQEAVERSLAHLGLTKDQGIAIFDSLDIDQSESLNADEFVHGIMGGTHTCRVYDVMSLQCDLFRTRHHIEGRMDNLETHLEDHKQSINDLIRTNQNQIHNQNKAISKLSDGISEILRRLPSEDHAHPRVNTRMQL